MLSFLNFFFVKKDFPPTKYYYVASLINHTKVTKSRSFYWHLNSGKINGIILGRPYLTMYSQAEFPEYLTLGQKWIAKWLRADLVKKIDQGLFTKKSTSNCAKMIDQG